MRSETFLASGYYLLVSTAFLLAVVIPIKSFGPTVAGLKSLQFIQDYEPIMQFAIWEVIFLCVVGWFLCVLFFKQGKRKLRRRLFSVCTSSMVSKPSMVACKRCWSCGKALLSLFDFFFLCVLFFVLDFWTFDSFGWPLSPVYAVLFFYDNSAPLSVRQELVFIASFLYAIRLNGNYFQANGWSFIGLEDWRYVIIRKQLEAKGINWSVPGFVLVYISQWLMVWLATIGIYDIMTSSHNLNFSDMFGFLLIVCGVLLEFVADQQLINFISFSKSAKNPVMKTGLWSVSRHPNYIGQMLIWVSLNFSLLFFCSHSLFLL
jgi:steroid 5-alpha reductase family enzyme